MTLPDWQLPPGVDRGLWDYLHAADMVAGYDAQMAASPLAAADVTFCDTAFPTPGRLIDLGCGTGRLCRHFAAKGYECVGVDLSDEMLAAARSYPSGGRKPPECVEDSVGSSPPLGWVRANLTDPAALPAGPFDYAACLFSTLGMVRGADHRAAVLANAFALLRPGGVFVLHAHNRHFRGLGWKRALVGGGDIAMSQAYGGAPLTLHHFTRRSLLRAVRAAGFTVDEVRPVGIDGRPARWRWGVYGWLVRASKVPV